MNRFVSGRLYPVFVIFVLVACGDPTETSGTWQYPLRFGDGKHEVHKVLGPPHVEESWRETFPASGVAVWFADDKVSKFTFIGDASSISVGASTLRTSTEAATDETGDYLGEVPSDAKIAFGLTARDTQATFGKILGQPVKSGKEYSATFRSVWRKDGYVLDAVFLSVDRVYGGRSFRRGTLVSLDVTRGL